MSNVRLRVTGMTCGHCQQSVERSLKSVQGVYAVLVDLEGMTAEVDFDEARSGTDELCAAIEQAGYGAELAD